MSNPVLIVDPDSSRPSKHAHKLVAKTAQELAGQLYELVMSNNAIRAEWKRLNPECTEHQLLTRFVARNTARCLPAARATLALMLRGDDENPLKETILEALVLDASLMRGRTGVQGELPYV